MRITAQQASSGAPARPQGPCDVYATASTPCVAAHSTTRALYASYNGPLYQVLRQSDSKTLDIGVVRPIASPVPDAGGYADAGAQDAFCANTICVISILYDHSGKGNHLYQGAPGTFKGPAKGGFDTQPIADMAPVTIMGGHKAYGVYIMPGMGFRNNDATGIAINDEPEGIYYVIDGTHYDSGCCFDYGNSSTNGRAVGTGTMETTYFGTATAWGSGTGPGPWIMADMEAGLFSGYDAKRNAADPTVDSWRFVTAVVDGGGGNQWDLRGGNAQAGRLTTYYSGVRPGSNTGNSYFPMHKPGAILLGVGGDNGNGSSGTFYEGVMTTGYPSEATTDAVQANIVLAKYDAQRIGFSRATTFTPRAMQVVTQTFANTTGAAVSGVKMSIAVPAGWSATASGPSAWETIAPGTSVSTLFQVTSAATTGAGFLTGKVEWTAADKQLQTATQRVRNSLRVKINEVSLGSSGSNATNQFVELYNDSSASVNLSNWTLINTQSQWAPTQLATIPAGTTLASHAYYLLGLSSSGLAAPASPGETTILVRSAEGFAPGQQIDIDGETRTIVRVGTAASAMTTVFVPVSTGPWLKFPAGATNLPVTSAVGFVAGEKLGIDVGGNYELATVTAVGKAATQTSLSAAAAAGASNLRLAAVASITVGDTLTVGTGARKERVTVASVGTPGANGTGVNLTAALRFSHHPDVDVSDPGTGVGVTKTLRFAHMSADAVQALGSGIVLDRALGKSHAYGAPVVSSQATGFGYQGPPAPRQWFGGMLSASAGSIALLDAGGVLADAVVYGSQQSSSSGNGTIASPEIATLEGDQGKGGCIAVVPGVPRGIGGLGAVAVSTPQRSLGRYPDGRDSDSNCTDFQLQPATTLVSSVVPGANNVKVASVTDFSAGQTLTIDAGAAAETATIATVGTAGATTTGTATDLGATVIAVASVAGFASNQTISVGTAANLETAVIASAVGGARGGSASITVTAPLRSLHAAGTQVSGSGITLGTALSKAHASGAQVTNNLPTPGAPNQYARGR
ncbi:MAG: arabinofuranosidase catalytic domain-containing protein [Acidobacteriota bacterium]